MSNVEIYETTYGRTERLWNEHKAREALASSNTGSLGDLQHIERTFETLLTECHPFPADASPALRDSLNQAGVLLTALWKMRWIMAADPKVIAMLDAIAAADAAAEACR